MSVRPAGCDRWPDLIVPVKQVLTVRNEKGLHARASARFVETVEAFDADATVTRDGMSVPGDSIMGLLMLTAANGCEIEVETTGPEAAELAGALRELVDGRFGEGR